MSERSKRWYVLKTIAGKEKKAKEYIENELNRLSLNNLVDNILIPVDKVFTVRSGKRISKEKTIYPGYLFVEASLEGELAHIIKNIPNVLDFITEKGGKPIPMQDEDVRRIMEIIDKSMEADALTEENFIVGETVRIIDGPFKNFDGVIEQVNASQQRLKVIVKIFGRKTPLDLSNYQVEK